MLYNAGSARLAPTLGKIRRTCLIKNLSTGRNGRGGTFASGMSWYRNLPEALRRRYPVLRDREDQLLEPVRGDLPMKWLWITLPVVSLFLVVPALAENKSDSKPSISISPGELAPTQEMWFYEQYQKQYMDPKTTVRLKAEFRAEERMRRIAALRWFGFSNQRPTAS